MWLRRVNFPPAVPDSDADPLPLGTRQRCLSFQIHFLPGQETDVKNAPIWTKTDLNIWLISNLDTGYRSASLSPSPPGASVVITATRIVLLLGPIPINPSCVLSELFPLLLPTIVFRFLEFHAISSEACVTELKINYFSFTWHLCIYTVYWLIIQEPKIHLFK